MNSVIFSIDNPEDLHTKAKFLRFVDTLRALDKLSGNVILAIGCYKGDLEPAFIVKEADFYQHILPSGYLKNQESVLRVGGSRMHCTLEMLGSGEVIDVGHLESVSREEAVKSEGFTYRSDMKTYWILKEC